MRKENICLAFWKNRTGDRILRMEAGDNVESDHLPVSVWVEGEGWKGRARKKSG